MTDMIEMPQPIGYLPNLGSEASLSRDVARIRRYRAETAEAIRELMNVEDRSEDEEKALRNLLIEDHLMGQCITSLLTSGKLPIYGDNVDITFY